MPSPRSRIRHGAMGGARPDRVTLCSSRTSSVLAGNRMAGPHVWLRVGFLSALSCIRTFRLSVPGSGIRWCNTVYTWTFCYDDYTRCLLGFRGLRLRDFFFVCLFSGHVVQIWIWTEYIEMGSSCLVRMCQCHCKNKTGRFKEMKKKYTS